MPGTTSWLPAGRAIRKKRPHARGDGDAPAQATRGAQAADFHTGGQRGHPHRVGGLSRPDLRQPLGLSARPFVHDGPGWRADAARPGGGGLAGGARARAGRSVAPSFGRPGRQLHAQAAGGPAPTRRQRPTPTNHRRHHRCGPNGAGARSRGTRPGARQRSARRRRGRGGGGCLWRGGRPTEKRRGSRSGGSRTGHLGGLTDSVR